MNSHMHVNMSLNGVTIGMKIQSNITTSKNGLKKIVDTHTQLYIYIYTKQYICGSFSQIKFRLYYKKTMNKKGSVCISNYIFYLTMHTDYIDLSHVITGNTQNLFIAYVCFV